MKKIRSLIGKLRQTLRELLENIDHARALLDLLELARSGGAALIGLLVACLLVESESPRGR